MKNTFYKIVLCISVFVILFTNSSFAKAICKPIVINQSNSYTSKDFVIWVLVILSEIVVIFIIIRHFFKQRIKKKSEEIIEKQKRIEKSEEKFKSYLDHSPIGVFVLNQQGFYTEVNNAACRITGFSREELLKKNMAELQPPETLEEDLKAFQSMVENGMVRRDFQIVHKNGNKIWAEVYAVKISEDEYICYGANIEERKNAEFSSIKQNEELKIAKAKAEESDRLKTAFLQNLSHEIRTPLNAIMGFAQILPEFYNDIELLKRYSAIIKNRGEDLLSMINDLLDIAKIESGQITVQFEIQTLENIFNDLKEYFTGLKKRIDKEKVAILFECDENLKHTYILIDRIKTRQILSNLIHNALKFTEEGSITITVKSINDVLHFDVIDTGIGISEQNIDAIFDRFTQVQSTGKAHIGSGLGLAIVKGLLQNLQGDISVTSKPNEGTTFSFWFPYKEKNNE